MRTRMSFALAGAFLFLLSLAACSGGGGGGGATYAVGGTVSGLTGTLVLQNNGAYDLSIVSNGTFSFATKVADGGAYAVDVLTHPAGQGCLVTNGTGTIDAAEVTNVSIACADSGSLDPSFSADGIVTTATGSGGIANAVAIQTDGKIVVAGASTGISSEFGLARYNADGSLDTSFSADGVVTTATGSSAVANAVAIQADGRIVVAGASTGISSEFGLARYNADGSLDTSFSADGIVTTATGSSAVANAVAIQTDGKIVAAGSSDAGLPDFALVRYCANGHLDDGTVVASGGCGGAGFGTGGKVVTSIQNSSNANALAIQTDGRIVAVGTTNNQDFALARYNADGTLDATFGTGGTVTTAIGIGSVDEAYAVAIQPDGKILAGGRSFISWYVMALVRYCANGHLDDGTAVANGGCGGAEFGTGGKVVTSVGIAAAINGLAVQADGKIVAAGYSSASAGAVDSFALARYNADGDLDTLFDTDGRVVSAVGSSDSAAYGVAVQADGRIVAAGYAYDSSVDFSDFAVVRIWP